MAGGGNLERVLASVQRPIEAPDLRRLEGDGDLFDTPILPVGCPVTPLGFQRLTLWVLDAANQMQSLPTDCRKGDMTLIFGGDDWLIEHFPQLTAAEAKAQSEGKKVFPTKFDQNDVQRALITACFHKGIFDPMGKVFGRGAHRAGEDDDQLVLHMGRQILVAGEKDKKGKLTELHQYPAGPLGAKFFPALSPLPPPADVASAAADAQALRELFRQWNWVLPDAATLLLLGMSAQMHICGALSWRSHAWLSAPTAAGKSTLQKLLRAIHGEWCLHTEDSSEPAIRRILADDTLPVLIDEAEADDNPERQRAILNLMKKSSSGAKMHRADPNSGGAKEFTGQSCFLLSSVLHGLVKGEEWNRVAILEMRPIVTEPGSEVWSGPDLKHWRMAGRRMHRRMIEQWPRFARTLADYKKEIWSHGLEGRWQDTFGTLLACADCLLFDTAPSMEGVHSDDFGREREWVRLILPMMRKGQVQARTDVERCLAHLMAVQIAGEHGRAPESVGQWIMRAMQLKNVPPEDPTGGLDQGARDRLKSYGLRLANLKRGDKDKGWRLDGDPLPNEQGWQTGYLVVAYAGHEPLKALFRGTDWSIGSWTQSLGKIDGSITSQLKMRFGGPDSLNAIAIPLKALRGTEE